MFDKIVIEETDEGLNLDLRLSHRLSARRKNPVTQEIYDCR